MTTVTATTHYDIPGHVEGPVAVAMSGGVDSAVTAALLLQAGVSIFGVHMTVKGDQAPEQTASFREAARVAEMLDIPLYGVDLRDVFRRHILEPFAESYRCGQTPNPCARCNPMIKMGALFDWACQRHGARSMATGHYARVAPPGPEGRWQLLRGLDAGKDQSYYLSRLSQEQLGRLITPLGAWDKGRTRAEARRLGLPMAHGDESQDICFVPDGDYKVFLQAFCGADLPGAGDIVDGEGRPVGRHGGAWRYTIGQRRGLGIAAAAPLYVVDLDGPANRVVVGPKEQTLADGLIAADINYVSMAPARTPFDGLAQIRYRHRAAPARVEPLDDQGARLRVRFAEPQSAITPGQVVAFYDGDRLLAGGWIEGRD